MDYIFVSETLGLAVHTETPLEMIEVVRRGMPRKVIDTLAKSIGISFSELTRHLHVSERTLHRYSFDRLLSADLSDHILQIAKAYAKCVEVFEDAEDATRWLKQPSIPLGNMAPLDLMDTSTGIEIVMDELTRIEYGVIA